VSKGCFHKHSPGHAVTGSQKKKVYLRWTQVLSTSSRRTQLLAGTSVYVLLRLFLFTVVIIIIVVVIAIGRSPELLAAHVFTSHGTQLLASRHAVGGNLLLYVISIISIIIVVVIIIVLVGGGRFRIRLCWKGSANVGLWVANIA